MFGADFRLLRKHDNLHLRDEIGTLLHVLNSYLTEHLAEKFYVTFSQLGRADNCRRSVLELLDTP